MKVRRESKAAKTDNSDDPFYISNALQYMLMKQGVAVPQLMLEVVRSAGPHTIATAQPIIDRVRNWLWNAAILILMLHAFAYLM